MRCSSRKLVITSSDEKFISRDTARHRRIALGIRAACGTGQEKVMTTKVTLVLHTKVAHQ
jgi:hypothetical protein